MSSAIDEYHLPSVMKNIIKKLSARQGILGVVLVDPDGFTLDSNLDQLQAEIISGHVQSIISKVKDTVKSVKNSGEMISISVELESKELLITPDQEGAFTIVVLRQKESGY
ncbi:MAG: roadblock/LC7 domain-containing protein [Candidatus Hodarchaeales archaeon]|jgi:predicted regulator of Ras-like GTPase activity (Roadblock/LC7/MglB family)